MTEKILHLLFGHTPEVEDVYRWSCQKFQWAEPAVPILFRQQYGGPCGVLAVVQGNMVKQLVFGEGGVVCKDWDSLIRLSVGERDKQLYAALSSIVTRARDGGIPITGAPVVWHRAVLEFSPPTKQLLKFEIEKIDSITRSSFTVLDFVISLVLAKGIESITQFEMDDPQSPLITTFGHCSQELMNLMLFGRATSNVFDGSRMLGDGVMELKGVPSDVGDIDVGYLSELEVLRYLSVGTRLKFPVYPIWVIGSATHYTLLFSFNKRVANISSQQVIDMRIKHSFDQHAVDDGILMAKDLSRLLAELSLEEFHQSAKSIVLEDIVLVTDFIEWARPLLTKDTILTAGSANPVATTSPNGEFVFLDGQDPPPLPLKVVLGNHESAYSLATETLDAIIRTRWPTAKGMLFERIR